VIKEVTTFIETRASLTRDTDLFAGHRPQGITVDCDVVLESAGGTSFFELPERTDVVFQVLSRAKTYMTARARAWAIYNAIFSDWEYGSAGWMLPRIDSDSISTCDADTDWAGEDLSIDGADYKEGAGSLKDTVATPGIAIGYTTTYDPTGTWDWSAKKHLLFWLKSDRVSTAFAYARLTILEGANWRYWNLTFSAGEWTAMKLLLLTGDLESGTPPDLALIEFVHIRFRTADTTAFYKKIDDVRVGIEEYEAMVIEPLAPPQYIGQDEKGRYEFSTNYIFKIKKL